MSTEASSLTAEQRQVLQAIYDHFHAHAAWPTFIAIDRPLRREHDLDTAAVILTLPQALIALTRPGNLRPAADDELRLTLLGIHACEGGAEDTERFVRLLRWLAQQEMAYEPEPGSEETLPRVTSDNVAAYLGLHHDDSSALARLYAMLQLNHWGLSGSGRSNDGWYATLGPDIWRFRNVQTVEDCIKAREEWVSGAQAKVPHMRGPLPAWHYHVRVSRANLASDVVLLDLSEEKLRANFLAPYREGRPIVINGRIIPINDLSRLRISRSTASSTVLRSDPQTQAELRAKRSRSKRTPEDWLIADLCEDVTDHFITGPPGSTVPPPAVSSELATPVGNSYVNQQIIDDIRAKDGKSRFNVAKLLRLIQELNANYVLRNSYAAHALLRAVLDHIPPILEEKDFKAVANNYPWGRTDKRYIKKLADFRDQADDALHRQISAQVDVLDFDDMPASVCINRLLQACAARL